VRRARAPACAAGRTLLCRARRLSRRERACGRRRGARRARQPARARADAILDIVQRASGEFNAVNVSTAFHRLAKTWRDDEPGCNREELAKALEALTELALKLVSQFQGQARSTGLRCCPVGSGLRADWAARGRSRACACMGTGRTFVCRGASVRAGCGAVEGAERAASWSPAIEEAGPGRAYGEACCARAQGLGIVVWAFAKLGCDAGCPAVMRLLEEFAAEALRRLERGGGDPAMQLGAQSLSNLVRGRAAGLRGASAVAEGVGDWNVACELFPYCANGG